MRIDTRVPFAVFALGLALAFVSPVSAAIDIDLGIGVELDDDTDLYFALSSRYFERDVGEVRSVGVRFRKSDDLAVALLLSNRSGHPVDHVFVMRERGMSWWDVSVRLGIPSDVWFVPVRKDPGPPYGRAYGHWKKRGSRPESFRLTDAEARDLVAVRMIHEYYGVTVETAMDWRSGGDELRSLMSAEYRRRHGNKGAKSASNHGGSKSGRDTRANGKGNGKNK